MDDRFVVRPGEKVATDGVVVDGSSAIDASLLTGESVPVEVGPGDAVTGATVNAGGRLVVRATRVGAEVLESTRRIDTIVLDKTGTVTTGRMALIGLAAATGTDDHELLRLAGSLEHASEHPIAAAIAEVLPADKVEAVRRLQDAGG